jgi:ketosteroid isomerase-like protein
MKRPVAVFASLAAAFLAAPHCLFAQDTTGPQTGTQTGVQSGVQSGAMTSSTPPPPNQTPAQAPALNPYNNPGTQGTPPFATLPAPQAAAPAQQAAPQTPQRPVFTPIPMPALSPGVLELLKLEGQFSDAVANGGGAAFASWFADDAVSLNNGDNPVLGRAAIAAHAKWDPKDYTLTWYAEGAQMGPSNDAGFTWGHYDAISKNKDGLPVNTGGRYITFWKKVKGQWKVALDASANEGPSGGVLPSLTPNP